LQATRVVPVAAHEDAAGRLRETMRDALRTRAAPRPVMLE
jgi:hypothetical protein